jgi:hypothetical protein
MFLAILDLWGYVFDLFEGNFSLSNESMLVVRAVGDGVFCSQFLFWSKGRNHF